MSELRKSTLYDLSGLRLQQGADRVNPDAGPKTRPSQARTRVQDNRGNWTARDAGGPSQVQRFKRIPRKGEDDADSGGPGPQDELGPSDEPGQRLNRSTAAGSSNEEGATSLKREAGDSSRKARPSKKLKFSQGLDFLVRDAQAAQRDHPGETGEPPAPTAEMLQLIHLHAGKYYSDRGLLLKTVRLRRKGRDKKDKGLDKVADTSRLEHLNSSEDSDNATSSESETGSAGEEHEEASQPTERLRSMNRSLDGSALLAIGILAQEFVRNVLNASTKEVDPLPSEEHAGSLISDVTENPLT
ncbi:hypothetical protein BKA70DRAFT_1256500 [Coprinopsis sp. MPI-PUGE-AT-0042]|nr:hypothetical protein BKA70DRAFT_1256500 [Coprinopsis sp. MPI-PUGE-AT-0042]